MAYGATTRTGALGRRLSNHNGFWKKKGVLSFFGKRNNNIHELEGCFLRGQVSSNGFKVFNGWIVEPWILLVHLQKKLENLLFSKNVVSRDKKSSPECPGLSSCTVKLMLQYILRLQEEIHEKGRKFESLKEYPQWHWSENDI